MSTVTSRDRARLIPIRITAYVGTTLAACGADKAVLNIREPNVIRPAISAHRDIVAAAIVLTINEEPPYALGAEFCEGDFLGAAG
jgi:hypothetical protein